MLSRSDLPDLHVFAAIARRRSFKLAAIELGVTTSALSHSMRKLEQKLGVRLLHRTSRTVMPTPVGMQLAERLEAGFDLIGNALADVDSHRGSPSGRLRINVPRDAARLLIDPVLADFVRLYPQVELMLAVDDRPIDIIAEGYDAGIRYGGTVPEDMVALPLTRPLRWVVVASPAFLDLHGRPRTPDDLLGLPCVGVRLGDNSRYRWELGDGDALIRLDVKGPFGVNETDATIAAAVNGVGLGYVLERRALTETALGRLEIVLPEWASTGPAFYAYYGSRRQSDAGLRRLIDLIRNREGL
jgi:DNA-binding transcriptional LysR family regulator